ncbi:hypothetical protein, partial [Burkholderia sp. BE12]
MEASNADRSSKAGKGGYFGESGERRKPSRIGGRNDARRGEKTVRAAHARSGGGKQDGSGVMRGNGETTGAEDAGNRPDATASCVVRRAASGG